MFSRYFVENYLEMKNESVKYSIKLNVYVHHLEECLLIKLRTIA